MSPHLSRRRLLTRAAAAGAALATGGCAQLLGRDGPAVPSVAPDPLEPLLRDELALLASYDAAIAAFAEVAAVLKPVRDEHAAHADALRARLDPRRQRAVPASVAPAAPAPSAPAALAALAAAERQAVARLAKACLAAPADRAALLASITASEASHAVVLA